MGYRSARARFHHRPSRWLLIAWHGAAAEYYISSDDHLVRLALSAHSMSNRGRQGPAPLDANGQLHQFPVENEWRQGSDHCVQLHCPLARSQDDCNQESVKPKVDDSPHHWRQRFKLVARARSRSYRAANIEARWIHISPLDDDSSQSQTSGTYSCRLIWQIDSTPLSTHSRELLQLCFNISGCDL